MLMVYPKAIGWYKSRAPNIKEALAFSEENTFLLSVSIRCHVKFRTHGSVEYDPQRALAVGFFITRVLW